jgi:hypothetical protein
MHRRAFLKGLLGTALAGLFLSVYALAVEPMWRLRITTWALQPKAWPRGQKLRIVMIADIHAANPQMPEARVRRIVAQAQALGGDLICLMGDYRATHRFQHGKVPIEVVAPILATLRAPLGVHAILGNHDWWDDLPAMRRGAGPVHTEDVLLAHGVPVLRNRAIRIGEGGAAFWLAGLDSQAAFYRWSAPNILHADDLPATLAQITDTAPVILLAHEPDIFVEVPGNVALTLSGHTHGGQISLFGWSPFIPSAYGNRFRYGAIRENDRDLVVSGGLGCSAIPVRFGSPPEITVIDLS